MIKSMTGFGRGEYADENLQVTVEIRSVNHRYNDVSVRLPRMYSFAEDNIKKTIKKYARRGKIEAYVSVEPKKDSGTEIVLNDALAGQYVKKLGELKEAFGFTDPVRLEYVASMPDVLKVQSDVADEEEMIRVLCAAAEAAAEKHDEMKRTEGAKLSEDLLARADLIGTIVDEIEQRSPVVVEEYKNRFRTRIRELTGELVSKELLEERILLEAAVFADKINVTEETVRLKSHISQLRTIIETSSQPDGKKLDFLVQEMNREANTIGSKANDIEITNRVLILKSEIEKIREQVQNIE